MTTEASDRVVDQRCRNRIMEVMGLVADGAAGVRAVGEVEWVNRFYDFVDEEQRWRSNTCLTPGEVSDIADLQAAMDDLVAQVGDLDLEPLIDSGWPDRVAPLAHHALGAMLARGIFDEEAEEPEPANVRTHCDPT